MSSLWMGENHLVYVKGSGFLLPFTERYFRYRYQDIQYLAITQTSRVTSTILYTLGLLVFGGIITGIVAAMIGNEPPLSAVIWVAILTGFLLLFLLLLMRNQLLGPTCKCDLRTDQKRERLAPLRRLHIANHAVELLTDIVEQKQQAIFQETQTPLTNDEFKAVSHGNSEIPKTVVPAFIDYLAFGIITLAALHFESVALWAAALALAVLGNVMMISSIARSFKMQTPDSIRRCLLALFSFVMLFGGVAMVYFFQMAGSDRSFVATITGPFQAFAGIPNLGGIPYYIAFLLPSLAIATISLAGVINTLKWQNRIQELNSD